MHIHPRIIEKIIDRRFLIAVFAIALLFVLGYTKGIPVSSEIAMVAMALGAANAAEAMLKKKDAEPK